MAAELFGPAKSVEKKDTGRALQYLILVAVVLTCILAFGPMLEQFFTGTDTITLIETGRINNFQDFRHILTQPLMAGSDFLRIAKFYRPVSTISYSIDYWLWGMNPAGFHLANLVFQTLTCILIFVMMRSSFGLRSMPAGFGAIIFAIHPILVETVPSLDRRHDIIAGLLVVLCVIFCAKCLFSQNQSRRYLWISVACQIGAIASKETAFFVPGLILIFVSLFAPPGDERSRLRYILNIWCPYVFSAFLYLLWRMYVLGGVGGYAAANHGSWSEKEQYVGKMAVSYLYDLLSPVDSMWQPALTTPLGITLLGAVIVILPLATEFLLDATRHTDSGHSDHALPKIRVFLICWLLLPLGVYSLTLTFGHRGMYIPTIAFSCLIGLNFQGITPAIEAAYPSVKKTLLSWKGNLFLAMLPKTVAIAASVCVVCILARYSPVLCNYGAWQASADLSSNLLRQFIISASILPDKGCVFVNQVPDSMANTSDGTPQPKEVAFPQDYSFTSWLKLYLPRCHARVILGKRSKAKYFSGFVRLTNCMWTKRTLVVFVSMGKSDKVR